MQSTVFEWEGQEYEHNPKSADWYWVVGIVATALLIACVLFGNYLLALLVLAAAVAVVLHGAKHPHTHRFYITDQGLIIDTDLHPFEHIRSFSMLEYIEGDRPPMLSIKTESWLSPHLLIPLTDVDVDALYAHLLDRIDEGPHEHTFSDAVAGWLGF